MRPFVRRAGLVGLLAVGVLFGAAFGFLFDDRRRQYLRVRSDLERRRVRPTPPGSQRLSVVVPAFGEGERIADSIGRLRAALDKIDEDGGVEIVVVDDGSADDTRDRALAAGADQALRHDRNRGKGAAVRTGVLAAHGRTIAFTDADLAYSPDQIVGLLQEVEAGWDVVTGSRRHTDTTTLVRARRLREIGGRAINALTARSPARPVPRHPVWIEGLSCRRRSPDLRPHSHRRFCVRRRGVLPRRAVPPVAGRSAGARGELLAVDGARVERRVAARARSLPHTSLGASRRLRPHRRRRRPRGQHCRVARATSPSRPGWGSGPRAPACPAGVPMRPPPSRTPWRTPS